MRGDIGGDTIRWPERRQAGSKDDDERHYHRANKLPAGHRLDFFVINRFRVAHNCLPCANVDPNWLRVRWTLMAARLNFCSVAGQMLGVDVSIEWAGVNPFFQLGQL
jgi:hypothetical protein